MRANLQVPCYNSSQGASCCSRISGNTCLPSFDVADVYAPRGGGVRLRAGRPVLEVPMVGVFMVVLERPLPFFAGGVDGELAAAELAELPSDGWPPSCIPTHTTVMVSARHTCPDLHYTRCMSLLRRVDNGLVGSYLVRGAKHVSRPRGDRRRRGLRELSCGSGRRGDGLGRHVGACGHTATQTNRLASIR
jgi:hypothetical protein